MTLLTKKPVQVYLEESQDIALRRLAETRKVSLSALIRSGVDLLLAEHDSAWDMVGLGQSGIADLGKRHDDYLVELIGSETEK
jgi:hypothetical protein